MPRKYLYTITTGRSGTVFLSKLLQLNVPDATVFHERFGFPNFGITCPDASHSTAFNHVGNVPAVAQFWKRKLLLDSNTDKTHFMEISHVLAKAGLVENLPVLPGDSEIHLVALKRDVFKILWSYVNRFDFFNTGFTWLFTLDPRYPNTIISGVPFREHGMFGVALWYIWEVFARQEYYRLLTADVSNIKFHSVNLEDLVTPEGSENLIKDFVGEEFDKEIKIPEKQNETKQEFFSDREKEICRNLIEKLHIDPTERGAEFFKSGKRLGTPGK